MFSLIVDTTKSFPFMYCFLLFTFVIHLFYSSYKELLPLIPTILNKFHQIYNSTHSPTLRHVIIELCLTIPSRLSALLPHLPLLVKVIIPALNSKTGSLINLALRTLEFWCDNLHPDYLHPIFATQDNDGVGHCTLMMALTQHLQPAPYPYGLLCVRLLGKLGGTNRLFLREGEVVHVNPNGRGEETVIRKATECGALSMYCEWQNERFSNDASHSDKSFLLPFPLRRAVDVLRYVSAAPSINVRDNDITEYTSQRLSATPITHLNFSQLNTIDTRALDLNLYSVQAMEAIKYNQSKSAFAVIRAALASVLEIDEDGNNGKLKLCTKNRTVETNDILLDVASNSEHCGYDSIPRQRTKFTQDFKLICDGLFVASVHDGLENEAMLLLKGLGTHIFYFLLSHRANITRIDRDGCLIDTYHEKYNLQNHISEKLQPLKPFGTFRLSGPLEETGIDPFSFNKALADAFAGTTVQNTRGTATIVMRHLIQLFHRIKSRAEVSREGDEDTDKDAEMHTDDSTIEENCLASIFVDGTSESSAWGDILFESLLSTLCQSCFNQPWNHRTGIIAGLFDLITKMGLSWAERFEVEILHTAIFIVKDTPDGIAHASQESVRFFLQVSWFFFGGPLAWKESNGIIYDVLNPPLDDINEQLENPSEARDTGQISVKEASLTLILSEIASAKPLVR